MEQAYLTAIYILGSRYHSGQWSKWYRLSCIASNRSLRIGIDLNRTLDNLKKRKTKHIYTQDYIKSVAYFLRKLRKYRDIN